jgi:hypothetical protein
MKSEHYLVTLKTKDRPGLLHLITGVLLLGLSQTALIADSQLIVHEDNERM